MQSPGLIDASARNSISIARRAGVGAGRWRTIFAKLPQRMEPVMSRLRDSLSSPGHPEW
jgi:hypothetical protein